MLSAWTPQRKPLIELAGHSSSARACTHARARDDDLLGRNRGCDRCARWACWAGSSGPSHRTRTRPSRSSSAAAHSATCCGHVAVRARRRTAPLHFRVGDRAPGRRADRAASGLARLRGGERSVDRAARSAPGRPDHRRRRGTACVRHLGTALPRDLRPDVQPLPLHEPALVPGSPLSARHGWAATFRALGVAVLAMLASHPYAVLVVAAQGLFILVRRRRVREAALTARGRRRCRRSVLVGGHRPAEQVRRRSRRGRAAARLPTSVLHYFWWVAGDFSAGHHAWSIPVLFLALVGAVLLWRRRREVVVLVGCVIAIPALAFMLATLNSTTSPEARHLIFALPFFSILLCGPARRARAPSSAADR